MKFRNYLTLIEDLIEENYHPFWPTVLESITEDDYQELAIEYWKIMDLETKQKWMKDEDFIEIVESLMMGAATHDIDDTMFASTIFMENLKDFFIDEIINDLEKQYFAYEYSVLYEKEAAGY